MIREWIRMHQIRNWRDKFHCKVYYVVCVCVCVCISYKKLLYNVGWRRSNRVRLLIGTISERMSAGELCWREIIHHLHRKWTKRNLATAEQPLVAGKVRRKCPHTHTEQKKNTGHKWKTLLFQGHFDINMKMPLTTAGTLRAWLLSALVVHGVVGGNPDAKRLYDDLLSNYNKLVRPVVNTSDVLKVCIKLKLSQLIDVVSWNNGRCLARAHSFINSHAFKLWIEIRRSIQSHVWANLRLRAHSLETNQFTHWFQSQNLKNQIMTTNLWVEQVGFLLIFSLSFWTQLKSISITIVNMYWNSCQMYITFALTNVKNYLTLCLLSIACLFSSGNPVVVWLQTAMGASWIWRRKNVTCSIGSYLASGYCKLHKKKRSPSHPNQIQVKSCNAYERKTLTNWMTTNPIGFLFCPLFVKLERRRWNQKYMWHDIKYIKLDRVQRRYAILQGFTNFSFARTKKKYIWKEHDFLSALVLHGCTL